MHYLHQNFLQHMMGQIYAYVDLENSYISIFKKTNAGLAHVHFQQNNCSPHRQDLKCIRCNNEIICLKFKLPMNKATLMHNGGICDTSIWYFHKLLKENQFLFVLASLQPRLHCLRCAKVTEPLGYHC